MHAFTANLLILLKRYIDGHPVVCVFPSTSGETGTVYQQICESLGLSTITSEQPFNIISTLIQSSRNCKIRSTIILAATVDNLQLLSLLDESDPLVRALVFQKAGTFQLVTLDTLSKYLNVDSIKPMQLIDAMALVQAQLMSSVQMAVKLVTVFDSLENIIDLAWKKHLDSPSAMSPHVASRIVDFHQFNDLLTFKYLRVTPRNNLDLRRITWESLQRLPVDIDGIYQVIPMFKKILGDSLLERMLKSADDVRTMGSRARRTFLKSSEHTPLLSNLNLVNNGKCAINTNPTRRQIEQFMSSLSSTRIFIVPLFCNDEAEDDRGICLKTDLRLKSLIICKDVSNAILIQLFPSSASSQPIADCVRRVLVDGDIEKRGWFLKQVYKCLYVQHDIHLNGTLFDLHVACHVLHAGNDHLHGNDINISTYYLGENNPIGNFLTTSKSLMFTTSLFTSPSPTQRLQVEQEKYFRIVNHAVVLGQLINEHVHQRNLQTAMFEVEAPLISVLAHMEISGVPIDYNALRRVHDELRRERMSLRVQLNKLMRQELHRRAMTTETKTRPTTTIWKPKTNEQLNVSSTKDIKRMLFGYRKRVSLNKEVLKRIANDDSNSKDLRDGYTDIQRQFARFYLRYKQITQVLQGSTLPLLKHLKVSRSSPTPADHTTVVDTLDQKHSGDVRVQCEFIQMASYTGRISTRNPNLQCLSTSHGVRHLISVRGCGCLLRPTTTGNAVTKATRRRKILTADYSQIELRIIASLSQDDQLCALLNQQVDVHRRMAAFLYRVKLESSVTVVQRQTAKQLVYSILYGASVHGIAKQIGVPYAEANRMVHEFFRLFPKVQNFIHMTVELASTTGYVTTVTGRRIMTNVNKVARNMPVIMNMPIQATQADMIKLAMTRIHKFQQYRSQPEVDQAKLDCRLILQLHDELVFEVAEDDVEDLIRLVLDSMIQALPLSGVQIAVKIGVGDTWQEASESAQLRVV